MPCIHPVKTSRDLEAQTKKASSQSGNDQGRNKSKQSRKLMAGANYEYRCTRLPKHGTAADVLSEEESNGTRKTAIVHPHRGLNG